MARLRAARRKQSDEVDAGRAVPLGAYCNLNRIVRIVQVVSRDPCDPYPLGLKLLGSERTDRGTDFTLERQALESPLVIGQSEAEHAAMVYLPINTYGEMPIVDQIRRLGTARP